MPNDAMAQISTKKYTEEVSEIHKNGRGSFTVRWVEIEVTRRRRTKTLADHVKLTKYRRDLLEKRQDKPLSGITAQLDGGGAIQFEAPLPEFGSSNYFRKAMGAAAEAARQAAVDGNRDGLAIVSQYTKVLSEIARSYQHYDKSSDVEEELEKLVKFHETTQKQSQREGSAGAKPALTIAETLG